MRNLLFAAFTCLPAMAASQSFGTRGTAALGSAENAPMQSVGFLDVMARLPLSEDLSFEAGTYLFMLDGKRPHETYGALVWRDQWRAGVVRPAYDLVLPSPLETYAPFLAYERAEFTRAFTTTRAMRATAVPWGLSYQGETGALRYAASFHNAAKGGFRSATASIAWEDGPWQAAAAFETVWMEDGSHRGVNAKLGAAYDFGPAQLALTYLHPDASQRPDAMAFDLTWQAADKLQISGFGQISLDGSDDAYGLSAGYALHDTTDLRVALTDGTDGPGWHVTLSHQF